MSQIPMWRRYLRFLGPNIRGDVDDEFRFHLEMRTQELIEAGMQPDAARTEALRQFGDLGRVKRELLAIGERRERVTHWSERLEAVSSSVRHAARRLVRAPAFTLAAVSTLAFAIGANTTIFTVVHRVLLNPLPYPDSGRLIALDHGSIYSPSGGGGMSLGLYYHFNPRPPRGGDARRTGSSSP